MTRLINADKLKKFLWGEPLYSDSINERTYIREYIDEMPTVDAVPVRHGRWKFIRDEGGGNSLYSCSECDQGDIHCPEVIVPYCWHCGAKMDAERDEE